MQDEFFDNATKMLATFLIGGIIVFVLFFILVFFLIRGVMKSRRGSLESVKEGEKSVYYSGYGKAKKNTKKEKQIQRASLKSTKVCNMCGKIIPNEVEICPSCGSNEFQD